MTRTVITVADRITRLNPYIPGKSVEGYLKLASNENSLGPSPKALAAVKAFAEKMNLYPESACHDLRHTLAERLQLSPDQLLFSNGSDEGLQLIGMTFLEPGDEVVYGRTSFPLYKTAATLNDTKSHSVKMTADWVHDLDAMAGHVNANTRLVFIANPNNPTGTIVGRDALTRFLERIQQQNPRTITVLDEAYYEYAAPAPDFADSLGYLQNYNVIGLRTFSKAYGLAGLRIGYGFAAPEIAGYLNRTRGPFNVNSLAQTAAVAALDDQEHVARTVAMNEEGKRTHYAAFDALGLSYAQTYGNFVWVDVRRDSKVVCQALEEQRIIVRPGHGFGAPNHLRVTIGTPDENARFLNALKTVLL